MSNLFSVNYNDLKFNLYEIMGLAPDTIESKIRKKFIKLVVELHPDKNKNSNEEIYNHLIIANQVLTNSRTRKEYDDFLNQQSTKTSHNDLKAGFKNNMSEIEQFFPSKNDAVNLFSEKINELNKQHGFNKNLDEGSTMLQYETFKKNRNNIHITQEKIADMDDFNRKFENLKETKSENVTSTQLNAYQSNDTLTTIGNYSQLYVEDSVSNNTYSSLDMAFKLQNIKDDNIDRPINERMSDYKSKTKMFGNRKF